MTEPLCTLVGPCSHAVTIKKSRFLAQAVATTSADAALAFVDSLRDNGGSHHCWAFRIGQAYRFNDDGEPSSSAGKPILAAIDGQGFDQVVVVVTRWFGGTKLGIGGLVRAYGGTAARCLQQGERRLLVAMSHLCFTCTFSQWAHLEPRLREWSAQIGETAFRADGVIVELDVVTSQVAELTRLIGDITQGRSLPQVQP
ncbi:MAG TPA: YigZ family protein [Rhodanobacteraceae bacterium]